MSESRPQQFPIARQSAGLPPPRRPGSIRRTTTIDSHWPDGQGAASLMTGRGRDLLTPTQGAPQVVDEAEFLLRCSPRREILALETAPPLDRAIDMIGTRAGGASRLRLSEVLPDARGTLLYQLLDDFAGASLVAPWAWSKWTPDWPGQGKGAGPANEDMDNICTGFATGASSHGDDGRINTAIQSSAPVDDLPDPADPLSWHRLVEPDGPGTRRARRLDLWREGSLLKADVSFQDSAVLPTGGRAAVHEYRVFADMDAASGALVAIRAIPHILPYAECPGAALHIDRLVGKPVADFRDLVLTELAGTLGCTHLNDVARSLADIPALARSLG